MRGIKEKGRVIRSSKEIVVVSIHLGVEDEAEIEAVDVVAVAEVATIITEMEAPQDPQAKTRARYNAIIAKALVITQQNAEIRRQNSPRTGYETGSRKRIRHRSDAGE